MMPKLPYPLLVHLGPRCRPVNGKVYMWTDKVPNITRSWWIGTRHSGDPTERHRLRREGDTEREESEGEESAREIQRTK